MFFDIVISVGPNDIDFIPKMLKHTMNNIIDYRNIYLIVANNPSVLNFGDNVFIINENIFDFDVARILGKNKRNGWYLQQLIKLYAWKYIDGITDYYLVLDADTLFLKPTTFFIDNIPLYNVTSRQNHIPYFVHMEKLHPTFKKQENFSAVTNHMIFNKDVLCEIMSMVENYHSNGLQFWEYFLMFVEKEHILHAGASEYEIYFNFIYLYKKGEFLLRHLNYAECGGIPSNHIFDYVSCHHYMRGGN